jgi:hypothetical protein
LSIEQVFFRQFFRQQGTFAAFPKVDATMGRVRKKGDGWHRTFRFRGKWYYFAAGNLTEEQSRARHRSARLGSG